MGASNRELPRSIRPQPFGDQPLCVLTSDRPSFSELATTLGCDRTNVTGMIERLERRGLLARERASEDRRVNRVTATQGGANS
ncbi:MarR family transcriptional regulator [Streptomyces asiaticus]|uniref:MarR family transcriptional regulator n=1 Tax=Streptomyces asiaticus TaxID=114695 RepID=UPI0037FC0352